MIDQRVSEGERLNFLILILIQLLCQTQLALKYDLKIIPMLLKEKR